MAEIISTLWPPDNTKRSWTATEGRRGAEPEGWLATERGQLVPPIGVESHVSKQRFETRDPWPCGALPKAKRCAAGQRNHERDR